MASIRKEILIDAAADIVWAALRDVGALHRLMPGVVTDTQLEPGVRIITLGNGEVARELIVDLDEKNRRLVWAIVDKPFQHYNSAAQVFAENSDTCRFVWIADLLPNELTDHVTMVMEQGLSAIKATMEKSAT